MESWVFERKILERASQVGNLDRLGQSSALQESKPLRKREDDINEEFHFERFYLVPGISIKCFSELVLQMILGYRSYDGLCSLLLGGFSASLGLFSEYSPLTEITISDFIKFFLTT